jgi:hypothetical protein
VKVSELIEVLRKCDPELPIATHAMNHTYASGIHSYSHGPMRVILLHTYGGDHICIGDVSKMRINHPNWYGKKVLDEAQRDIPQQWTSYP